MGNAVDETFEVIARTRNGHVETGAAPSRLERFAVFVLVEPILMRREEWIVGCSGKRHEPDARRQAELGNAIGGRFHAAGVGAAQLG